jgi:hypothetical protein
MQERHQNRKQYFCELAKTSKDYYLDYLRPYITLTPQTRVLEIGCGEGGNLLPFAELGCEVKGDQPSRMLTARLETAIAWLQDHPDVYCVVSGGTGEDEMISEAECMYRYMTAHGIAPERIIREDRSVSTRENLSFSLQKLQEAGLLPASGSMEGAQIAVVTNEFHACRALCIAGDLGIRAGSVPASSPWWLLPTFYVRELYGLLYQIFL